MAEVKHISKTNRFVTFKEGPERKINVIFLCTGYVYDTSFLSAVEPSSGKHIPDLYEQMLWTPKPILAFVGLTTIHATFPVV